MKNYLLSILLICIVGLVHAQEKLDPRFSIKSTHIHQVLELEIKPVNTLQLSASIFTAGDKRVNTDRIKFNFEVTRGKQIKTFDISTLSNGEYFIEVIEKGKGRIYRKLFTKE